MAQTYSVKMTVLSQSGTCNAGHKVGDSWVVDTHSPGGGCFSALAVCFPYVRVLRFGGEFPWSDDKDTCSIACPDAQNPLVFEMKRLR